MILLGKPIAITGASSGIGAATALACARSGMPVALGARRIDKLQVLADQINRAGGKAIAIPCDVGDESQCHNFIARATEALGPLHAVFANAGYGFEKPVSTLDDAELERIFRINFWGSLWTIRPALEQFKKANTGHIIWCSSCVAKIGLPFYAPYSASKAMQDHFGRSLRLELAADPATRNIMCSTVHPIGTDTEFFDIAAAQSAGARLINRTPSFFTQSSSTVATAIVRRLAAHKGGEIWTSLPTRLALAGAAAFPGLADLVLTQMVKKRLEKQGPLNMQR
jgi:short-subunit dehydrogenase